MYVLSIVSFYYWLNIIDSRAYYYYQDNVNLYPYNEKNAILFIEIYKKDGVFNMNLSIFNELVLVFK